MIIALDYDGTYTEDPDLWNKFLEDSKKRGHIVYLVTMRFPEEENDIIKLRIRKRVKDVIFTGRKAKKQFVSELGININVWIDDSPEWILGDSI